MPAKPDAKYAYRENKEIHVLSESAFRAIALAQRKFPGLEVFTVVHRGKITIIEEKESDFPEFLPTVGTG